MTDLNVSLTLRAIDMMTAPFRKMSATVKSFVATAATVSETFRRVGGSLREWVKAIPQDAAITKLGAAWSGVGKAAGNVKTQFKGMATNVAWAGGAVAGLGFAFKRLFLNPASQFETFRAQLDALTGSSEGGRKAMAWVQEFAKTTPANVAGVVEAFTQMKAFGLDPMDGTMQAIMDTTAKMGFSQEKLMGISLALGQSWTSQKLQGQDIMQLMSRGIPVWDLLSKATGRSALQLKDLASKGKLGRDAITLLIQEMGKSAAGSAAAQMKTWAGLVANLEDAWTSFTLKVMEGGLFDYFKSRLSGIMATIDAMAASGELDRWAKQVGESIQSVIDTVVGAVKWVGGLRNALIILGLIIGAKTILAVGQLGVAVGGFVLGLPAAIAAVGELAIANGVLAASTWAALGPTILITAAIGVLAAAVYVMIAYWSEIHGALTTFYTDLGLSSAAAETMASVTMTAIEMLLGPLYWVSDAIRSIIENWDEMKASAGAALDFALPGLSRSFGGGTEPAPSPLPGKTSLLRSAVDLAMPGASSLFGPAVPGVPGGATNLGGTLKIQVDSEGRPKVKELRAEGALDFAVDVGRSVPGF